MKAKIKKLDGVFPVTVTGGVYLEGTNKTLKTAIENGGGTPVNPDEIFEIDEDIPIDPFILNTKPTTEELSAYQPKTDKGLNTTDKTIVGSINEIDNDIKRIAWHYDLGKYIISNLTGNKLTENITIGEDEEFSNIELVYDSAGARMVSFRSPFKVGEVDYVKISSYFETEKGFVSLGKRFFWNDMKVIDLPKGVENENILYTKDIPNTTDDDQFEIGFGEKDGTTLKGKVKIKYVLKSKYKINAEYSLSSEESVYSKKSEYSNQSDISNITKCAGVYKFNEASIVGKIPDFKSTYMGDLKYELENLAISSTQYWAGFHIQIDYDNLEELNTDFQLNYKKISGADPNKLIILSKQSDWAPSNNPVDIDIDKLFNNDSVNLYEIIKNRSEDHFNIYIKI